MKILLLPDCDMTSFDCMCEYKIYLPPFFGARSVPADQLFSFPAKSVRKVTCTVYFAVLIGSRLHIHGNSSKGSRFCWWAPNRTKGHAKTIFTTLQNKFYSEGRMGNTNSSSEDTWCKVRSDCKHYRLDLNHVGFDVDIGNSTGMGNVSNSSCMYPFCVAALSYHFDDSR